MYDSEDPHQHYALGRALGPLRSQGIQIITSGMAVHNLRDISFSMLSPHPLPYTETFDEALREAVESSPVEDRESKMAALLKRDDARRAHLTFEHLLPLFVGAGAAGEDQGKRICTLLEKSLSWAMFRFGEVPGASK
jgi:4,5-DOPA dioxygenase extradiol